MTREDEAAPTSNAVALESAESAEVKKEAFGAWLQRQRKVREIGLREIADATKISLRYLQALEEDRFDVLPAAVFAKGFLRQYARYVGIDPEEAVNFFIEARQEELGEQLDTPRQQPAAPSSWRFIAVLLATAAVLIAVIWLLSGMSERRREAPSAGAAAGSSAVAAAPAAREPADPPPSQPLATAERQPPESVDGASAQTAALASPAAEPQAPLNVTLDFVGQCWVEAAVDGRTTLAQLKIQGESLQLRAERSVVLKVGDYAAVRVEVNGRPLALANRPAPPGSTVRRVHIDLETAAALAGEPSVGSGP